MLCEKRRCAAALHGRHDRRKPFQRGSGLCVHVSVRHGNLRRGICHGTCTRHQHGHSVALLYAKKEPVPAAGEGLFHGRLAAAGRLYSFLRPAVSDHGSFFRDCHHRIQRGDSPAAGKYRRGGLWCDRQPVPRGDRHLYWHRPGRTAADEQRARDGRGEPGADLSALCAPDHASGVRSDLCLRVFRSGRNRFGIQQ